ncbi:cysteine--tRNA ligase [Candidatus Roizmanbacteria bacterium RIFCSPLOWO2_01_FULL_37_12]|uniref:Cysteine--tRNA ligase n=1 Tax=Candidatus Roizmanbacteria bacterium RIFCSPLOWO2_01_FULL_37_12 TaxID=1802056 RepID=A0A1F7IAI7_9BACT|nr:MAG: cysteine--tRNA ligase [Candidatus Roizmanbacteria bacterium RIFCSPHIGHO2_02_FULL_37_9b]OGK40352.1 MAG: cysteine--tRNA ligase [Candidatus Roizmanbacteria bacterium RIFCSPLOWO2_01_FULL_37_12]
MKLYNSLTRRLEDFKPLEDRTVKFYHCGPTVYWVQHIGNLRAMTWADLIRRSLIFLDNKVIFVRNYTDVGHLTSDQDEGEDKMEKASKREGLTPDQIAEKYIKIFEADTEKLNILPPGFKPKASEFIPQMQDMIKILLDKNHAYFTDYAVYFDVSSYKNYNQLNRQNIDLNIAGSGKGKIDDPQKRHFADFALWFFKKGSHRNALQTWASPWGEGFPGWHIECSVMAKSLLGQTIDIHMGGIEHIAVHHTNEIAQSEAANGVKFVNYWLHNEHLSFEGEKMAKSKGTGFTLAEIQAQGFDPLDLRYFYLNAHYRSKQNFTWNGLSAAREGYFNLKNFVFSLRKQTQRSVLSKEKLAQLDTYRQNFSEFISNDCQIPQALALTWTMLKSSIPSTDKLDLLFEFDQVFGLKLNEFNEEKIPQQILRLAKDRIEARKKGDFELADNLRKQINEKGFIIEDIDDGFKIKKSILLLQK